MAKRKFLESLWTVSINWVPERFKKPLDIPAQQTGPDFSPQQIREFRGSDHADKARKFIESIRKRIQPVYHKAASQIEQRLNEISEELSNQITTDVEKELRDILDESEGETTKRFSDHARFPET